MWRLPFVLVLALGLLLLQAASGGAVFQRGAAARPVVGSNTELVMTGEGPGRGLNGFVPDADNPFDPVADGYPLRNPTTGWTRRDSGFAGVIYGRPSGGGEQLKLYCIDLFAFTRVGIGYGYGTWDAANVRNVGYVGQLLNEYYPATNQPSSLPNVYDKAAAVQAAIWFFSDSYVLSTTSPLRSAVVAIVDRIKAEGPLVEPPPPSLSLEPSYQSGPAGSAVGPFALTTNNPVRGHRRFRTTPDATVNATGRMYSDAAGTVPIANGATVPSGQEIWMRSAGPSTAEIQATATAVVPTGSVYLYDGNAAVDDAQPLILAATATLSTTVRATAEFLDPGSLIVTKTIAGPAAGSQGRVVIHVVCDDGTARPDFVIAGGASAGSTSRTYGNIPAGTVCVAIETTNGSAAGADVVVTGDGQVVTIPAGGRDRVQITDTYQHVVITPSLPGFGSLLLTKTIAGPLAGHQGPVTIHVVCDGSALPPFVIPAKSRAGSVSHRLDDIPADSACTIRETADGTTDTVAANVAGNGQSVTVPAGKVVPVNVMNVYYQRPSGVDPDVITKPSGTLKVTKTIRGADAGRQGPIAINVACGGPLHAFAFLIPAHTGPGSVSRVFPGLPPGARCTVTETADGATTSVTAVATGRRTATIPVNGTVTVPLADTYSPALVAPPTGGLG
jgi:Domain of unknown function (DUF5979)/Thioester domain